MANYIKRGESILIPFRNNLSIADSQNKPRTYKTKQAFEKAFPRHYYGTDGVELVEYAEVRHGSWISCETAGGWFHNIVKCSECNKKEDRKSDYCPNCGAKMDLEVETP